MIRSTILFLTVLLIISSFTSPKPKKVKWLSGTWVGTGYEPTLEAHWLTRLDYNLESGEISVSYPLFPCSGHWELVKVNKRQAIFIEHITVGTELCQDEGTLIVTMINDKYINVAYFLPEYSDDVTGFSVLRKQIK